MIPPDDFSISDNFIGLIKENIAAIQVMDMDGGNFYTNAANYNKQGFEKKGIKVLDFKELFINGYPCKYICMQGDTSAKVLGMVFGDTTFSVMVMATYPSKDENLEKSLDIALRTIYYEKGLIIDPFVSASFKLDDRKSIFKFFRSSANLFIYSIGGNENEEKDQPVVIVSPMPADITMTPNSLFNMLVSGLEKNGLNKKDVKDTSSTNINGYNSYEGIVNGELKGIACTFYLLTVLNGDKAVTFQGIIKSDFENNINECKKLAYTLKFK